MPTFIVHVDAKKEIPSLIDIVANRVYTIDGVTDVEAIDITSDCEIDAAGEPQGHYDGEPPRSLLTRLADAIDAFLDAWNGH